MFSVRLRQNPLTKSAKQMQRYGGELPTQVPLPQLGHLVASVWVGVGTLVVVGGSLEVVSRTVTVRVMEGREGDVDRDRVTSEERVMLVCRVPV